MNDVDETLTDAGHPIGMTSQRPIELIVENKKEHHGISTQIQTQPLNPLKVVVTSTV
jgi:hypothetical protein